VPLDDGETGRVPLWVDQGESSVTVEDLQSGDGEGRAEVAEEIAAVLAGGKRPSRDVKEAVSTALKGSRRTVERHATAMAKDGELLIHEKGSRKPGEPPRRSTDWELPPDDDEQEDAAASSDTGKLRHPQGHADVVTCAPRIPEPNSGLAPSSGDTPRVLGGCAVHRGDPQPGCRYCREGDT
jgi:hypothetical protein